MSRTFVCQVVPKQLTSKLLVSQAANNFCFNLIETNCFDNVVSLIPINITKQIVNDSDDQVCYVQSRFFKSHRNIFKLFNAILESIQLSTKVKEFNSIWYYNVTPHNLFSCLILKYIYKKQIYVILADYTPSHTKFSLQYFIKVFIEKRVSGIISLSARNIFTHANMDTLAGIIPVNKIHNVGISRPIKNDFLLSGRLEESTGLLLAVETFSQLPECNLYITGVLNEEMKVEVSMHQNIFYLGLLSYEEYIEVLEDIPYSLNFRNPNFDKNMNNFPSKIIEAFSYNRIVVSTCRYSELSGFRYFYSKYEKKSLMKLIREIIVMTNDELESYSNHSLLLEKTFSEQVWKSYLSKTEIVN